MKLVEFFGPLNKRVFYRDSANCWLVGTPEIPDWLFSTKLDATPLIPIFPGAPSRPIDHSAANDDAANDDDANAATSDDDDDAIVQQIKCMQREAVI